MAPEMLANNMDCAAFEGFKAADVYSFSLILWEIVRRTRHFDSKVTPIFMPTAILAEASYLSRVLKILV